MTEAGIGSVPSRPVEIIERRTAWQGYFRIDHYRLRHGRFAGGWSGPIEREVLERGHAVAVLMVDPDRDRVILIEQFRIGALAAGREPWMMEVVAGIIDDGETPEQVARREAAEESGCTLLDLERICDYLPSPGGSSETTILFCARVDSRDAGGIHGLAAEHEDILVHTLPVEAAVALLDGNRLGNAVTIIALAWLARHYPARRQAWLNQK